MLQLCINCESAPHARSFGMAWQWSYIELSVTNETEPFKIECNACKLKHGLWTSFNVCASLLHPKLNVSMNEGAFSQFLFLLILSFIFIEEKKYAKRGRKTAIELYRMTYTFSKCPSWKKTLTAFTNRCARVWMVWVKFNCYHLVYKPNDFLQQANSIAADFTAQNIESHHIIWLKKLIFFSQNKFIWKNWFLSSIIGNEISIFQLKHLKNVPQLIPIQNYNMKFIRALL